MPELPAAILLVDDTPSKRTAIQSILEPLGGQMHAAALDMRGHGQSDYPADQGAYSEEGARQLFPAAELKPYGS